MAEKKYEMSEVKEKAMAAAKELIKDSAEVMSNKLAQYFEENALFAVNVSKELIVIVKESVNRKSENQKQFILLCDKAIDSCNLALKDDSISDEEKLTIRQSVSDIVKMADESNKQYQKDQKEIVMTGIKTAGIAVSAIGIVGAIATAITKSLKK